ncbi:MAG: trehalose-6-phosphate synthase, partial [Dehalococcoidia bacterium]
AAPSRTAIPEYQDERAAIEAAAQHVQERFGAASLEVGYDSQPPAAVAAALARADVCVVTSVADGMNLVAKEFAAVHSAERPGVLVLSDSCGAAEELTDALVFPAGDAEAMSAALRRAYDMPEEERRERSARLRAVVDGRTAGDWLEEFAGDLESIEPRARPAAAAVVRADGDGEDEALRDRVEQRLGEFERDRTIERLWTRDYTLWKPEPDEITDRLGWLEVDRVMGRHVEDLRQFAADAGREGYTTVVLIGMGGSSLAPRVFASAFAGEAQGQRLIVLDSTVPAAVRSVEERVDPGRTLFIASSKSGTTLETRALLDYFWERHPEGRHWVAITDAGSPLHTIGEERSFRRVFLNPADIGGRYSALSFVGLVPAALLGIDLERLLASAASMREACGTGVEARVNPGARLGAMLAEAALMGRDYLAVDAGPELAGFPAWLEQLIAESTGKDGGGILPLVGEAAAARHVDGPYARTYTVDARAIDTLTGSSYPVHAALRGDPYALGAEYFRWEFGVAVAGRVLGINPFDQPDVEAAKAATRLVLDAGLPAGEAAAPQDVLAHVGADDYLALHAYLARDAEADARLTRARARLSERFGLPVTLEYGPSLLHSTGQYHKGGPRRGHFIQILDQETPPLEIPGRAYDFGELKNAQAEGDRRALEDLGLAVGRCTLDGIEEAL